jgi:WD40 repeat protein
LSGSTWTVTYTSHPHLQPILSLSVVPLANTLQPFYLTSSADANITKHDIPTDAIGTISLSQPAKTINTKHSGQQGLQIRNDGKIFATAGWDSKVRVYATKSLKELAVLKWHKEGCYAVAFADVKSATTAGNEEDNESSVEVATKALTVAEERQQKAENTHWLAVGSKDGKVSLWDIY